MYLYWLSTGMFGGHSHEVHTPALVAAAASLVADDKSEAPYSDFCHSGRIKMGGRDVCLGGIVGTVFTVIPKDDDAAQGAQPGSFLIPSRDLERLAAQYTVN